MYWEIFRWLAMKAMPSKFKALPRWLEQSANLTMFQQCSTAAVSRPWRAVHLILLRSSALLQGCVPLYETADQYIVCSFKVTPYVVSGKKFFIIVFSTHFLYLIRVVTLIYVYLVIEKLERFLWDIKKYVVVITFFSELCCMC